MTIYYYMLRIPSKERIAKARMMQGWFLFRFVASPKVNCLQAFIIYFNNENESGFHTEE